MKGICSRPLANIIYKKAATLSEALSKEIRKLQEANYKKQKFFPFTANLIFIIRIKLNLLLTMD